ncbi:hypothetical protein D8B26_008394 [Coccidioides posadasii str. Silveira]|uniref:uncharacterized protein n=1 Tax=Coccidioides posadasii (strain RMSCC 757 / Silveira) TaxID=443226 RepID=UPI001BEF2714|nr:hypothetical protein D8B26_008394 [Coccidioides posadasii str. Silveira]
MPQPQFTVSPALRDIISKPSPANIDQFDPGTLLQQATSELRIHILALLARNEESKARRTA